MEPWPKVDMHRNNLLPLITPFIPQLEPVVALEAAFIFFIIKTLLPFQD
jgi:hypothetical protein